MKKLLLLSLVLISSVTFAQDSQNTQTTEPDKRDVTQNELSIGALNLVAFGAIDLTFERIIDQNSSWAIEGFIKALDRDNENIDDAFYKDFSLTGKYKYFFGDRYARGFYVHGFGMLSSGEYDDNWVVDSEGYGYYEYEDYTDFALGFGIGGKFVSKGGFFLDLGAGIGRNLLSENSPTIVGQFNVNLGFRF
ncbi:hypothetical protein APR41_07260 [Salegentibacter salinarum]|uniref:DUF3575 domain-containing protein n=1 Tax=Salegentibacter salinarum TaxID=447422 RepID=A0A2N0TR60_9FLAO|nr:hypothetical protein [Salegentibacter salinarum]PKD17220.1 hypothetical protein APR41_07260 [Salegentibacter salinarum]SKB56574.1 hypothetical protein SAMN05660903_01478 [Salegentibacter salinarum]